MSRTKTLLRSLLAIGAAGAVAAFGTFSAFSSTTSNPDNQIQTGTVKLTDNDLDSFMYDVSQAKAGDVVEKCINISYDGSLAADVKLYLAGTAGALGPYLDLTITPGTQTTTAFPSCSGFSPAAAGAIYTGTLAGFATAHTSWADGLAYAPDATTGWTTGTSRVFKVRLAVQDTNAAQNLATDLHGFTWEARNR